jgi:hypothetical protein
MKHFNNIRKHLRNQDAELPTGFSWEEMEAEIFDRVDQKGGLPLQEKKSNTWNTILMLLMAIMIIGLTVLLIHTQGKVNRLNDALVNHQIAASADSGNEEILPKFPIDNNDKGEGRLVDQSTLSHTHNRDSIQANEDLRLSNRDDFANVKDQAPLNKKYTQNSTAIASKDKVSTSKNKESIDYLNNASIENTIQVSAGNSNTISKEAGSELAKSDTDKYTNISSPYNSSLVSREQMGTNPLSTAIGELTLEERLFMVGPLLVQETPASKSASKWSGLLAYGLNFWSFTPEEESNNIYQYTEALEGSSVSARLRYQINPRWAVSTGLDLDFLRYKVDAEFISLQERMVEDAVVEIIVSPTGGRTEVRRDTFVVDTLNRQIRHFNTMRAIQIPIMLQARHSFGQWSTGIGIGPSLHGLMQYEGRYLENEEAPFFESDDELFTSRWSLALNTDAFIERSITERIATGLKVSYTHPLGTWGNNSNSSIRSSVLRNQLYLRFSF